MSEEINRKRTYNNGCAGIATGKEHVSTAARGYQPEKNIYQPLRGGSNRRRGSIRRCRPGPSGQGHQSAALQTCEQIQDMQPIVSLDTKQAIKCITYAD